MGLTTDILLASAPALNGLLFACLMLRLYQFRTFRSVPGAFAIASGLGIQLGLILFSLVMIFLDRHKLNVFHYGSLISVIGLIVLTLLVVPASIFRWSTRLIFAIEWPGLLRILTLLLLLPLIASSIYFLLLAPAQGWDSLDFWLWRASEFIDEETGESYRSLYSFSWRQHHPDTVSHAYAWTGWVANSSPYNIGALAVSAWVLSSIVFLVYGFSYTATGSKMWATLTCLLTLCVPLIQNHIALAGYADLWVANVFLASLILGYFGVSCRNWLLLFLSIAIGSLNVIIKDAGIIFVVITTVLGLFTFFMKFFVRWAVIFMLALALIGTVVAAGGFEAELFGNRIAFDPEVPRVEIGRRTAVLSLMPVTDVLRNVLHALLFNASYNILFFVFVCASAHVGLHCWREGPGNSAAMVLLLLSPWALLILLVLMQLVSETHFEFSSPDFDTYFSRFALAWSLAVIPLFSVWVSLVQADARVRAQESVLSEDNA